MVATRVGLKKAQKYREKCTMIRGERIPKERMALCNVEHRNSGLVPIERLQISARIHFGLEESQYE